MSESDKYFFQRKPELDDYKASKSSKYSVKKVFRITPGDLMMLFDKKNLKQPDNEGESRQSLNMLRDCGYNDGLVQLLVSDKESGIIGDHRDLERRQ